MKWPGVSQRKGTLRRLEADGKDVKAVTLYTHTFVLFEDGRADEQKQPFYTATADTPQEAEAQALAAYHRAQDCLHRMEAKGPALIECIHCGLQRRIALPASGPAQRPPGKPERKLLKLLGFRYRLEK